MVPQGGGAALLSLLSCASMTHAPPPPRLSRRRAVGLLLLSLLCCASIYTSYLLAALHETPSGQRLNTYREMGEVLLGERRGARGPGPPPVALANRCRHLLLRLACCRARLASVRTELPGCAAGQPA